MRGAVMSRSLSAGLDHAETKTVKCHYFSRAITLSRDLLCQRDVAYAHLCCQQCHARAAFGDDIRATHSCG
jgi:hypothetical protein